MKLTLRALRINSGLTRQDVARRIGLSPTGYRRIEATNGQGMKVAQLLRICDLYGVDVDSIYLTTDTVGKEK